MANEQNDRDRARSDFLIAMYNQLMNDINRHIVVVWQSVGVLFGAFAIFALVEKHVVSMDVAASAIILLCAWLIAHVYDASYWYNRNLVIIANIERQFLRQTDLREIHYYFGKHRKKGAMITHLEIQKWLAVGVGVLVLGFHFSKTIAPILFGKGEIQAADMLPWLVTLLGLVFWWYSHHKAVTRYETFLKNSPGKEMDASGIEFGPGHPVDP